MHDPQDTQTLEYLWTSGPHDCETTIKQWPPLLVSWAGLVEDEPRHIRSVNLPVGAIIQIVTMPTLKRGYIPRGVADFILCEIDSQENSQEATLIFVGIHKTIEDADAWITEASA